MTLPDWESVIYQVAEMKCRLFTVAGGEPLLSKNVVGILKRAKTCIKDVSLLTNGTLLTPAKMDEVAPYITSVQISLDAVTPNIHDGIRGHAGLWAKTVAGIKVAVASGVETRVKATICKANLTEVVAIQNFAYDLGVRSVSFRRAIASGRGVNVERVTAEELHQAVLDFSENANRRGKHFDIGDPFTKLLVNDEMKEAVLENTNRDCISGCSIGVSMLYIAQDGSVALCPYLPIRCGNVKEAPILDIWRNAKAYKLARSLRNNLEGKCGTCAYKYGCGGCRAHAYYETGNICAEDSGCWHQ